MLHSTILGSGQPLLILHGLLGMSDNWKTYAKNISNHGFEVHLIDQRNHGRSFHSSEFSYKLMAQDVAKYCDYHRLERCVLLGHSMGGKTAMNFAGLYPERLHKLLIVDIAPKQYPPHHHQIFKGLTALNFDQIHSRKQADEFLEAHVPEMGVRQFLLKNLYWQAKNQLGFRANIPVLDSQINEIGAAIPQTHIFNGPTLFLKGEKSDYITDDDLALIKRHFPIASVETIQQAGHWLHAENPSQFFEKTVSFLLEN